MPVNGLQTPMLLAEVMDKEYPPLQVGLLLLLPLCLLCVTDSLRFFAVYSFYAGTVYVIAAPDPDIAAAYAKECGVSFTLIFAACLCIVICACLLNLRRRPPAEISRS